MKSALIVLFCLASGISLGSVSAGLMATSFKVPALYVGSIIGGALGLISAPLFVMRRQNERIFEALVACFVLAFPVAAVSGLTNFPWLGILLTLISVFSVFIVLVGKVRSDGKYTVNNLTVYIGPTVCLAVAAVVAGTRYESKSLPDDIPTLIERLGDNDIGRHLEAGRRLSRYGRDPLLSALQHHNPAVRSRAAHFLGLLNDPSVQPELIKLSRDPDPHVRLWVAFSLGKIGDSRSIPTLVDLSQDKEEIVRIKAREAIMDIQSRMTMEKKE